MKEKKPAPGQGGFDLHEALKSQPEWLREELETLKKHEDKVLRALEDDENARVFMTDPARLLRKLGVPVSGPLKNRFRADMSIAELTRPLCVPLADGKSIQPKVRIRFTR